MFLLKSLPTTVLALSLTLTLSRPLTAAPAPLAYPDPRPRGAAPAPVDNSSIIDLPPTDETNSTSPADLGIGSSVPFDGTSCYAGTHFKSCKDDQVCVASEPGVTTSGNNDALLGRGGVCAVAVVSILFTI